MRRKDGKPPMPKGKSFDASYFTSEVELFMDRTNSRTVDLAKLIGVTYHTIFNGMRKGRLSKATISKLEKAGIRFLRVKEKV